MRRRGRHLRPEEQELWAAVKRSAIPLKPAAAPVEPVAAPEPPPPPAPRPVIPPPEPPRAAKPAVPALQAIARREKQNLLRGRSDVDGRIDLHGYRQDEAHGRLIGFLAHGHARGWKMVLVITGKGRPDFGFTSLHEPERGVLKRMVPLWLALPEFRRFVLGFEEAHHAHGGTGALYVRLRRRKAAP